MKQGTQLYDYLEKSGVLVNGSKEDIENTKKIYWSMVRKEWKRNKRKECKSYTIFFTKSELKQLKVAIESRKGGIANYIKQTVLTQLEQRPNIDKHFIGIIREELAMHYSSIVGLEEDNRISKDISEEILKQIERIEKKVFGYLKNTNNNDN